MMALQNGLELVKKLALSGLLFLLLGSCATKVGNPDNDDDQDNDDDKVVLQPIDLKFVGFPDVSEMDISDLLKPLLSETFVLMDVSTSMLSQLNEFFVIINEHGLTRSGDITLKKDGITLTGKSWYSPERNGLYFCAGDRKAFHITWDADDLHVVRNLAEKLPVTDHPMTKDLDAVIEAQIGTGPTGSLSVTYSGIKRDPETLEDTDKHIAFHYDALQPSKDETRYSGLYVDTDETIKIPEEVDRRLVGEIDATGNGQALVHLAGICETFDEKATGMPAWCFAVGIKPDTVDISDDVASRYDALADIKVPLRADLKKVEFPTDMTCP